MQWIHEKVVHIIHEEQLAEHGGTSGIRDEGLLQSALARPQNILAYGEPTVFDLAAAYAYGVVENHPFLDGNKRTGFLLAYVFLSINGWELDAPEPEAVLAILALASGKMNEKEFAVWLEKNSKQS